MPLRRPALTAALILAGIGGLGPTLARGDDDAPLPVRSAAERLLGRDADIAPTGEGGTVVYEASRRTEIEIVIAADGALRETRIDIPVGTLPDAVAHAARTKAAQNAALEAEVVLTADAVRFAVEATAPDGRETEYLLDVAGSLLSEKTSAGDDEDDRGKSGDDDDEDDGHDDE